MANRTGLWWRAGAAGAGLLGLAGAAAALAVVLWERGPDTTADVAQLVAVGLTLASVAVGILAWWRRPPGPETAPTREDIEQAADALAEMVAAQWEQEAELRSLHDPEPMPVRWRLTDRPALMDLPEAALSEEALTLEGTSNEIAGLSAKYRALHRRRLVLLGGPGTGKTTLAVQLLRHLVRARDSAEPVPVLLSVAHWNTATHPDWRDWMAQRLRQDYPALRATSLGERAPERLAHSGCILPVLDGLDELSAPNRVAVVGALNRSLGDGPLILTSRSAEFAQTVREADEVLSSSAVVVPHRLRRAEAADYLDQCLRTRHRLRQRWAPVLTELRAGPASPASAPLREMVATPVGLWLLRTVYLETHADPRPLLDPGRFPTPELLRKHLWDQLIPATIQTRTPSTDPPTEPFRPRKHHNPEQVRDWLSSLAHHLDTIPTGEGRHGTRDFAWWELARHTLPRSAGPMVGILTGLTGGLVTWLVAAFMMTRPMFLLFFGLLLGLITGFGGTIRFPSLMADSPAFADFRIKKRKHRLLSLVAKYTLACWIPLSIVLGLTPWLIVGYREFDSVLGLAPWVTLFALAGFVIWSIVVLLGVLPVALVCGLLLGLTELAASPAQTGSASTPLATWRADRSLNLLRMIGAVLPIGLVATSLAEHEGTLLFGIAGGFLVGLGFAPAVGFSVGRHHAWPVYLVATFYLGWKKRLPRRLVPFLDDAHRLGLLRAVGPIYQFRHAELQDHLARTYGESSAATQGQASFTAVPVTSEEPTRR
ncbi:NACHT domain-containing protein [Streptomonospora sp. PA3]|uniref:NACHT domain-containing protein n=1 Tax=Streptomonospora sp. PA3 TaxID=2607326 RepID=UPI00164360B6